MNREEPNSRPDLTGVHPHYTWEAMDSAGARRRVPAEDVPASPGAEVEEESEVERLRVEVARLRTALEDVVALALGDADARQRAIVMQRRAIAALNGLDTERADTGRRPPSAPPTG